MSDSRAQLDAALEQAFSHARRLYAERGFQRRVGFGRKPALGNVDLANAWTRPGNPFTCENIDAKFGDVTALQQCLHYLETVGRHNEPA